ncbi:phytochrome sensor protein [Candidatus Shapirobacteria bacterium CG08_land_8_20_14_0_20_39_18]|uniref:Phytochrome sensor protein n=1 Tax=Candidatus Shapirobacteria bacterium CG08_land_8_20_14_0_20_39_18 TaxID=1974883 RepID=A0A2M6XED2_9BACT|nr:MAG: phytochrome sensor protein [Candidatus Shapirobacteria bacterium CG08_land_8_20_14_0_20_39_18]PIY66110.1 MAG: phytochrome sensor protein [Candidatus Shapirobacteria bacterium CG_4_10_14_0_8_um_filter_39_15]
MIRFSYKAKDAKGETVKGVIEAQDEKAAVATLRGKGSTVFSLTPVSKNSLALITDKFFNRVSGNDITNFTRQLSTMVTAGLTLDNALIIFKNQCSSAFYPIIDDILLNVQGGSSLAEALAKHPDQFSRVYVSLVKAGETAGVLDQILSRLADNLEKQRELAGKVKGAMIYPVIIIVGMIGVGILMMVLVIPKLLVMYKDFNAELPLPTKILMWVSSSMTTLWLPGLVALVIGFYAFTAFKKTAAGKRKIDQFILGLPLFGNIMKKFILTEIARTLGLLSSAGVSIVESINIVAESTGNAVYEEILKEGAKQVERGLPLSGTLGAYEEFPPIVIQMISVGEETGKLDEILTKLSKYFEMESDETVKGLTTAIEPLIMIVLGVGVAFLMMAIILPMYSLTSQF